MTYPSTSAIPSFSLPVSPRDAEILYQIDCCKASSGKTVSMTKRRVRWRFGFANRMAIEQGATGVDCRGYEHEVTFVWSVASGKKLIVHDQKEVHYSHGKREGKFTFIWNAAGHMFTLIAYAAPPVSKNHRAFGKQFELLIDNVPFDALPRIYQLGTGLLKEHPMSAGRFVAKGAGTVRPDYASQQMDGHAYHFNRRSVQDEMVWARNMHAMEAKRNMNDYVRSDSPSSVGMKSNNNVAHVETVEPLDLISAPVQGGSDQDLLSDPLPMNSVPPVFSFDDMYAPKEGEFINPSRPPSYEAIWSSIMDAYDTGTSDNANPLASNHGHGNVMPVVSTTVQQVESSMKGLCVDTSLGSKSSTSLALDSPTDVTAIDGAFQNLVNLDDISQPVLQSYAPASKKNQWEGKENVPLKDLKKTTDAPASREIMRTYAVYQQQNPGALVVYGHGQSNNTQQGPPPLSFGYTY
jgi:hypothetical protein